MNTLTTLKTSWQQGSRSLYDSRLWYYGLLAAGSVSNVLYYCTVPLVGIGVLAGTTLPRRRALLVLLPLWLVNQLLGFTVRGYPYTVSTFAWGGVMLLGATLAVLLASIRPAYGHDQSRHGLWLAFSLALGFVLYELVIWLGGFALGGVHGFTASVLGEILLGNAIWGGGLAIVHWGLVQRWMRFKRLRRTHHQTDGFV
ncbi:hypothetical protein C7293_20790 [filamentous cyanobacterium CCT1]|nr:hypothetical protein C7293_20790 [filamentous cyanobacterium CCT1]PSN78545.1 hypothetical protein C8B47_16325 [filamentous cyanobacterium CCP4]